MSTPSGYLSKLIDALRGSSAEEKPKGDASKKGPLEMQLDGYRQHVRESQAMGEHPLPYAEWIKQQPAVGSSPPG